MLMIMLNLQMQFKLNDNFTCAGLFATIANEIVGFCIYFAIGNLLTNIDI